MAAAVEEEEERNAELSQGNSGRSLSELLFPCFSTMEEERNAEINHNINLSSLFFPCFTGIKKSVGSVHPVEPYQLEHSEFLRINRRIKIRIFHVKPENATGFPIKNEATEKRYSINRNSLTEEYWFTRWNKPLKAGACGCSFRRSKRYSRITQEFFTGESKEANNVPSFEEGRNSKKGLLIKTQTVDAKKDFSCFSVPSLNLKCSSSQTPTVDIIGNYLDPSENNCLNFSVQNSSFKFTPTQTQSVDTIHNSSINDTLIQTSTLECTSNRIRKENALGNFSSASAQESNFKDIPNQISTMENSPFQMTHIEKINPVDRLNSSNFKVEEFQLNDNTALRKSSRIEQSEPHNISILKSNFNEPQLNNNSGSSSDYEKFHLRDKTALSSELKSNSTSSLIFDDVPPVRIINVATFAERLLQESLLEAFQEYYISMSKKCEGTDIGVCNLGFEDDDVDSGVVLRRNLKDTAPAILPSECLPAEISNNNIRRSGRLKCGVHKVSSENKPMVLLFHGIGSMADVWLNVINSLLSRGFEVAAPDMLGHGYSSAPKERSCYRFKNLLAQALAVFDHYAQKYENRKFILIGHSFGCSLATAISRYRPQQAVQMVLISGGGPTALSAPVTGNEISVFGCLQVLISPLLFCGIKRSLFYSTRGKHFQPCDDADASIPKYVLEYINDEQNWPDGDAAFHRRILIPTLLVHGLKDTRVTLVQECEMERTIPRAFLELIPTAGHMSPLETPEQLSHMILCFLEWWAR